MTFGVIVLLSILTLLIIAGGITIGFNTSFQGVSIAISIVICLIMWGLTLWYFQSTEVGKRALKTQKSNFNGGITREVKVYDVEGDLIAKYKGKFDIEYDDDRILFDDENGNRHVIYYPTGNVIVDEVE